MTNAARLLAAAALMLCAVPVLAQNAPGQEKGQEPPPKTDQAKPDPGTTIQENCLDEKDTFTMRGKQPMFVIEMTNKCERPISCKVFVYIYSAKGPVQGHGSIVMAAKSKGAAAKASFTMKAKLNGGSSQSTRECKAI
jgi:hypothetical protein